MGNSNVNENDENCSDSSQSSSGLEIAGYFLVLILSVLGGFI